MAFERVSGIGWIPGYDYRRNIVLGVLAQKILREALSQDQASNFSSLTGDRAQVRPILPYDEENADPYTGVGAPRIITK